IAIKPSSIRIWLHHKQMGKLAKVLWAGQGMRLRTETSHHPRMKRFLECVPHVMGVIKDIHQAVIDNDLDVLKEKTAPPAPRVILTSKDANGLTPLHKAAGLAHTQIVEYILSVWPSLSSDEDHTGKTPLHWAASAKNNARSFNLLVQAGADETALDDRNKPAEHYKNKPGDIDRSLLAVIPEAPRISQQGFPAYFDWAMFTLPDDSDEVAYGLDSLGKDLEPEEPLPDAARVTSAESDKNSEQMDSQPNSRATTGKSIKSTITVTDQDDIKEHVSRNSSATAVSNGRPHTASNGNMNGTVEPNDTPEDMGDQDGLTSAGSERPETRGISAHRTYPNSAKEPTSPNATSEQLLEKTAETHPDQPELEDPPQAVDETSSAKEEPMARTEIETVTQSATSTQLATAAATEASSQVLEIEGTVQGEPDQGQLQSQNDPPVEHDDQPNVIPYFLM
ncbi:AGAP009819-PA, partial [Anopheles gambiae str. PEST]